jgi:putative ABC transport system permease protein
MPDWEQFVRKNLRLTSVEPERETEIVQELAQQIDDAYRDALRRSLSEQEAARFAGRQVTDWNALARELASSPRGAVPPLRRWEDRAGSAAGKQMRWSWIAGAGRDVLFALRMMRKNPSFTMIAVLTLALGIGANSAIFSVVNGVMLRPLPYPDAGRLVLMLENSRNQARLETFSVSWQDYLDWRQQQRSFDAMGVFRNEIFILTGADQPERLSGAFAAADVFRAAAIRPLLGRAFTPEEDQPGASQVVTLSERLWRNRFNAAPGIVGRAITLDGANYTVIGVMPDGMRLPSRLTDLWVPLGLYVNRMPSSRDNHPGLMVVARLKHHVTHEQARAEMDTIAQRLARQFPDTNSMTGVEMTTLYESVVSNIRGVLLALLAAVGFVLLIACVNLANMTLARGEARLREFAVRSALGAARSRLVRQLLTESLLLSGLGAALGVALAWLALKALVSSHPATIPRLDQIRIDLQVLGFSCLVALLVALVFGLWPALRITSRKGMVSLADLTPTASRRSRLRPILVMAEVGLAMVLLVGASLMMRTFSSLTRIELGFRPEHVVTMRLNLPARNYSQAQWEAFYRGLLARVAALPGVQAEGISSLTPLGGGGAESGIFPEGTPLDPNNPGPGCTHGTISGGYFTAMGIELLKGRTFTDRDSADSPRVIVVDEAAARLFWPGQDPIGRRVAFEFRGQTIQDPQPQWREVVGVVRSVRHYDLTTPNSRVQVYVPYGQPAIWFETPPTMSLMVRTGMESSSLVSSVRREVTAIDPALPVFAIHTMTDYVDGALEQPRLSMAVMIVFGGLALVLAAVGIYGVLSYSVSQRTREIGVRMALGASRADVLRLILRQGAMVSLAGVAIGAAVSLAAMRLIRDLLYGVSPTDALTYLVVPLVLLAVALTATLIPARRATKIDPLRALRHE